jgi:hypothetical protein
MNKKQVVGLTVSALAVIGGVAVFNYFRKPKRNSEGFFGMDGRRMGKVVANCGRRNTDGSYSYYYAQDGQCKGGFKSVAYFGDRNL